MSLPAILLIVIFLSTMLLGIPVAWALALSCIATVIVDPTLELLIIPQKLFMYSDSFAFLAIPCFYLAGDIMAKGGLSKRLIQLADSLVGWVSGGISLVAIVACTFFAAISGSSVATTAAIGGLMYPEMVKKGYPEDYAAALQAVGGTLGIVIPPSIVFVIYGNLTGNPVGKLLMAGVIPGIITCIALCMYAYMKARKNNFPKSDSFSFKSFLKSFAGSIWALLMPLIILGGIYSGVFTATEASAVAALYGIVVCLAIYREMRLKQYWEIIKSTALSTASLMLLVGFAQLFGYLITYDRVPQAVTGAFMSVANGQTTFLLLVFVLLIICGMFLDVSATNLILGPILTPIALAFGVDPIHFGCFFVFMLAVGQATPPFGTCLFVASSVSKRPLSGITKEAIPMVCVEFACGLLFAFVPILSTLLPDLV
ncbi:MAG: TRAP transporter large permease [Oscillospiraceae bacterium]|jgi:C4-dicarboxylate transporter DctM subunit|nr:TRAP transporter large permease [Oscillospiraceae bacterium]